MVRGLFCRFWRQLKVFSWFYLLCLNFFFKVKLDTQISLALLVHQPSINPFGGAYVITVYALFQRRRIVKRKNSIEKGITVKGEFLSFWNMTLFTFWLGKWLIPTISLEIALGSSLSWRLHCAYNYCNEILRAVWDCFDTFWKWADSNTPQYSRKILW